MSRLLLLLLAIAPLPASADPLVFPPSIAVEALSETVPTAFSPNSWNGSEFSAAWSGQALTGIEFSIVPGSFEWVRVSEVLVVPRARLRIRASEPLVGQVRSAGFAQPLVAGEKGGEAELPVALLPGRFADVEVTAQRGGRSEYGRIAFQYNGPLTVIYDSSCSPFQLSHEAEPSANNTKTGWLYVGCRLVYSQASSSHASTLDTYVYWSGAPETISVAGVETPALVDSVWGLRLRPSPGEVELRSKDRALKLRYRIPEKLRLVSLGVGIGPYNYAFESVGEDTHKVVPLMTLYASYFLTDTMRIVLFDAMPFAKNSFNDIGLYLSSEYVRTVDRRLSINLLLGGHVIGFQAGGKYQLPFSAPQGFELTYRDALMKNRNVSAGAFLYPPINNRTYYNLWVRWGSPSVFAEFNYIGWQEPANGSPTRSRSAGVSVGFPLFKFL